jgi:hypothetical protein
MDVVVVVPTIEIGIAGESLPLPGGMAHRSCSGHPATRQQSEAPTVSAPASPMGTARSAQCRRQSSTRKPSKTSGMVCQSSGMS